MTAGDKTVVLKMSGRAKGAIAEAALKRIISVAFAGGAYETNAPVDRRDDPRIGNASREAESGPGICPLCSQPLHRNLERKG